MLDILSSLELTLFVIRKGTVERQKEKEKKQQWQSDSLNQCPISGEVHKSWQTLTQRCVTGDAAQHMNWFIYTTGGSKKQTRVHLPQKCAASWLELILDAVLSEPLLYPAFPTDIFTHQTSLIWSGCIFELWSTVCDIYFKGEQKEMFCKFFVNSSNYESNRKGILSPYIKANVASLYMIKKNKYINALENIFWGTYSIKIPIVLNFDAFSGEMIRFFTNRSQMSTDQGKCQSVGLFWCISDANFLNIKIWKFTHCKLKFVVQLTYI